VTIISYSVYLMLWACYSWKHWRNSRHISELQSNLYVTQKENCVSFISITLIQTDIPIIGTRSSITLVSLCITLFRSHGNSFDMEAFLWVTQLANLACLQVNVHNHYKAYYACTFRDVLAIIILCYWKSLLYFSQSLFIHGKKFIRSKLQGKKAKI